MKLLTPKQVAEFAQLSEQTLAHFRCAGTGPPYLKFGGAVRYREEDLHRWIEDRVRENQRETRPVPPPTMSRIPRVKTGHRLGGRPKKLRGVPTNEGTK